MKHVMRPSALILCATLALQANAGRCAQGEIDVYFTNNPPLICLRDGELDCIAGTLIKNAAREGMFKLNLHELPWVRAPLVIKGRANAIFAATGRNPSSESQFGWYAQVYTDDVFVWTLASKKIASDADIGNLKRINVRRGSPFGYYLDRLGYSDKVYETPDWEKASSMLAMGRLDGMCITGLIGRTNLVILRHLKDEELSKYKVGELAWWITVPADVAPNAELQRFHSLIEREKAKPYYQDMLHLAGVRP